MPLFKAFFLLFLIVKAAPLHAAFLYDELTPQAQKRWRQLLHFNNNESRVDDELFFVHPQGKENASLELEAFVQEYQLGEKMWGRLKLPLQCAFPARVKFLIDKGLITKREQSCSDWERWQEEVNPSSLMVVFSTAYPNNPGSMFGHTFLRFKNKSNNKDLLDYSASYSAMTSGDDSGVIYAIKGIFGGYRGFFDLHPHYIMVNNYNHNENRDLIEYHLNLSQEQLNFLLAHLWELYQSSSFDYFFTWENCSFHLADLINVVLEKPLELPFRWYYLPVDLIHALQKREGLIKKITQRPSQKRILKASASQATLKAQEDLTQASLDELDGLIHYYNYLKYQKKGEWEGALQQRFVATLEERARRGKVSKKIGFEPFQNQPHKAHEAQRISLGFFSRSYKGIRLKYRSGYHEFLSPDQGLESFSQFIFLSPTLSFGESDGQKRIVLDDFSLIEIASLHPLEFFDRQLSWKVGARYERFLDETICQRCGRFRGEGKMGLSLGGRTAIASFLLGAVAEQSGRFDNNYRFNGAYEVLVGYQAKYFKFFSSLEGRYNIENVADDFDHKGSFGLSHVISKNNTLRLEFKRLWHKKEWKNHGDDLSVEWGVAF